MTVRAMAATQMTGQTIVYDPCTGQTRHTLRTLPAGRQLLDDREVDGWPETDPAILGMRWPVSVCWSPLVRCNLACPHCLDDKTLPELGAADRTTVARRIAVSGVLGVDISGGEPLLLTDLPDLASHLTAGGCAVSITTNGWHLTRRAAELAGRVDAIRVSLDGPDPARHDAVRGKGSFDRAVDGIAASRAAGIPVQIQTVLRASMTTHLQAILDLAAVLGVHGVTFLQMLPLGEGAALPGELVDDHTAQTMIENLVPPPGTRRRLRTRAVAGNFTVVRADGQIWRNQPNATRITPAARLTESAALVLTGPDGSA